MIVYTTGTLLTVLFAYMAKGIPKSRLATPREKYWLSRLFAFISFLPLTIIMAVRDQVGTDFSAYVEIFSNQSGIIERGEYAFAKLNRILSELFNSAQSIFIVCAIIICGAYFILSYQESVSPAYSLLLFVICKDYFVAMNIMRQFTATAIVMCAIPFMKEKKWIQSLLIIVAAYFFHRSVVIMVLFYILYLLEIPPLFGGGIIVALYTTSRAVLHIATLIAQNFGLYSKYFAITSIYSNQTFNMNWKYTLVYLCFFLLLSYEYGEVKKSKNLKLLYTAVLMGMFIMATSVSLPLLVERLLSYFNAFIILYIPEALRAIKDRLLAKFISGSIIIAYTTIAVIDLLGGMYDVLPYVTMWG